MELVIAAVEAVAWLVFGFLFASALGRFIKSLDDGDTSVTPDVDHDE